MRLSRRPARLTRLSTRPLPGSSSIQMDHREQSRWCNEAIRKCCTGRALPNWPIKHRFSGAVALSVAADGLLSLGDTIGKWLPFLPRAWSKVTLQELLNHTSGVPDF